MDYLMVIDNATGDAAMMTLARASALTGISVTEIETTLETPGRCSSMDFLIIDTRPADEVVAA